MISTAGLILFRGFTENAVELLGLIATELQYGHMQIAHGKLWKNEFVSKGEILFDDKEIKNRLELLPEVEIVTSRMQSLGFLVMVIELKMLFLGE
ncbi:MAG: hypothetical protein NZ480_09415 [Bdellovibrionaceae bacterium]|nr:hypothetical protein [Pseudobdellovibrionaceae bacterium]MDW8190161.1 hypothetical protein [Pseudobdellovibrionaceae bacterium]